jgi:hypothetical protein
MRILARVSHQGQSTGNAQHTGRIDTSKLFLRQKFNLSLANRVESIDTKNDAIDYLSFLWLCEPALACCSGEPPRVLPLLA